MARLEPRVPGLGAASRSSGGERRGAEVSAGGPPGAPAVAALVWDAGAAGEGWAAAAAGTAAAKESSSAGIAANESELCMARILTLLGTRCDWGGRIAAPVAP